MKDVLIDFTYSLKGSAHLAAAAWYYVDVCVGMRIDVYA